MSTLALNISIGAGIGASLIMAYISYKAGKMTKSKIEDKVKCSKSLWRKSWVLNYIADVTLKLHPVQEKIIQATLDQPGAIMLCAPEQVQFLAQLVSCIGAKKTLDIGVFTGLSALSVALELPPEARVVACDVSEEYTNIARSFWREAGVDDKIDLKIAPAAETLQYLIDAGEAGTYDFAFIDADKTGYDAYYELSLALVRPGGIIALDNMLRGGAVADITADDTDTIALRALNGKLASDPRVRYSLLNVGDGTGLVFKL